MNSLNPTFTPPGSVVVHPYALVELVNIGTINPPGGGPVIHPHHVQAKTQLQELIDSAGETVGQDQLPDQVVVYAVYHPMQQLQNLANGDVNLDNQDPNDDLYGYYETVYDPVVSNQTICPSDYPNCQLQQLI